MLVSAERSGLLNFGSPTRLTLSLAGAALVGASIVLLGGSETYPGWGAAVPVSALCCCSPPDRSHL